MLALGRRHQHHNVSLCLRLPLIPHHLSARQLQHPLKIVPVGPHLCGGAGHGAAGSTCRNDMHAPALQHPAIARVAVQAAPARAAQLLPALQQLPPCLVGLSVHPRPCFQAGIQPAGVAGQDRAEVELKTNEHIGLTEQRMVHAATEKGAAFFQPARPATRPVQRRASTPTPTQPHAAQPTRHKTPASSPPPST